MTERREMLGADTVLHAIGGVLIHGDPNASFSGVSTDSRSIEPGELFFALRGEKFDGHHFISEVVRRGGAGVVVQTAVHGIENGPVAVMMVPDTLQALGDLANFWRKEHAIPLVAVVGSNGKTTTKEMLARILEERYRVLKNPGNLNNLIGLPLSLLKMNSRDQVAVLEMGMNRKGEIRRLTQIAQPNIAILTNINPVHLEELGSLDGVVEAKAELVEMMGDTGRLIYNADDPRVTEISGRFKGQRTSFGISSSADWVATRIVSKPEGEVSFRLRGPVAAVSVSLRTVGHHQVYNALAASAAASQLGATPEEIKEGLKAFQSPSMRMEMLTLGKGIRVINDTYNANPRAMQLALSTLQAVARGRRIAVLGDMAELGTYAAQAHQDVGHWVAESAVDLLFLLGDCAPYVIKGATESGMPGSAITVEKDHRELSHHLAQSLQQGDWVLVKGSRKMKMEKVIEELRNIL